jgi:hypothetical protein
MRQEWTTQGCWRPRARERRHATRCPGVDVWATSTSGDRACIFRATRRRTGRCRRDVSARTRGLEASSPSPALQGAGARKTGPSVISGECRVETIPFGADAPGGRKLAIDGLRLRLDLKIVPSAAGSDAAAAAIWRIENARLATLPLGVLASYRTLAVAAGLGAMLLAIGVWFVGAGEPTMKGGASEPSAARATGSPGSSASPRVVSAVSGAPVSGGASSPGVRAVSALSGSSAPEVQSHAAPAAPPTTAAAPVSAAPSVAPRIASTTGNGAAPLPPAAATTDATSSERAVRTPRGEPAQPPRPTSSQPANARAATLAGATGRPPAAAAAAASSRRPGPAAANGSAPDSASDDMLDLFGDPK